MADPSLAVVVATVSRALPPRVELCNTADRESRDSEVETVPQWRLALLKDIMRLLSPVSHGTLAQCAHRIARRGLAIQADRLNRTLHETCELGAAHRYGDAATETGMRRLALDDNDARARHWFRDETERLGCTISVDQMGNMFAVRPGKRDGPPTAMGSHLDTQPSGGRYDGILGVMAAVEALRTLHDQRIETEYPVAAVNWTNEEGARFPISVVSSAIWAGKLALEKGWECADIADASKTMKSELDRIGYLGSLPCSHEAMPLGAHFELHIEQGPILEAEGKKIGAVKGAQAYRWYDVVVTGRAAHTGSTPYSARSDALLCASRIMLANNLIAKSHGGLATTGVLTLEPGSTNVTPSTVKLTVDARHPSSEALEKMEQAMQTESRRLARWQSEKGCTVEWTRTTVSSEVVFDDVCVDAVKEAGFEAVGKDMVREMFSGAGHDSCMTSYRCPTAMIFVPSRDGISHNPREYTGPEDWCVLVAPGGSHADALASLGSALGAQVLLGAVLRYDQHRAGL